MCDPGLHTIFGGPEHGYQDTGSEVDIVAVHGLNFKNNPNHARATWSCKESMWIKDFLPSRLQRPCRVMLFAYNSSPAMGAAAMRLDDHARTLLRCLMDKREATPQRPIVFLCHSLGGIVVKSALVEATLDPAYRSIVNSTRLLVFFATPHLGGNYSEIGDVAAKIVRAGLRTPSNDLLDGLKAGSRDVIRRFEQARHLPDGCLVISFYETEDYGRLGLIVEKSSAVLNLPEDREKQVPMKANHSKICKFQTADSCEPVMELIVMELDRALELHQALEPAPENMMVAESMTTKNVHWLAPRRTNSFFTGRDDIVRKIADALKPDNNNNNNGSTHSRTFVLTGIGGQGKSEVCLNVVNQIGEQFWGVFWVDVGTESRAIHDFTKIAHMLGSDAKNIHDILIRLSNCSPRDNWLLVLDNADDMDTDYQKYIPSGTRGAVLMSSRIPQCRLYSTVGYEELGNLSEADCVSLLLKVVDVHEEARAESIPAAQAIAREVGFHTLALIQAGAYIASGHCTVAEYAATYRQQHGRFLRFDIPHAHPRYRNVYAAFEVSAQVLETSEKVSARDALCLLELLSTLHYDDIPANIFEDAWNGAKKAQQNPEDDEAIGHLSRWHVSQLPDFIGVHETTWDSYRLSSALSLLCSMALVKRTEVGGETILSMHPLIHSWVATRQHENQRQACVGSSACFMALTSYSKRRRHLDRLGPHLTSLTGAPALAIDDEISRHMLQVLLKICESLNDLRWDQEVSLLLDRILRHFNASPECVTEDLLPLYSLQSLNQYNLGKIQECIKTIENVRVIQQSSLEEYHPDRITTDLELARAFHTNGRCKDAIAILEKLRDIHEQRFKLRKDHPAGLTVLHLLGSVYHTNGQTKEAIALLKEVVAIKDVSLKKDDLGQISSKYLLASAYVSNCQIEEAIELFEEIDSMQATLLHDHHPNRLGLQSGLAKAYLQNGQTTRAIALFEEICEKEKTLEEGNPSRLATEHLLASAYRSNGQLQEAMVILQNILRVSSDHTHPNYIEAQFELGATYLANGQTKEAIELLEKVEMFRQPDMDSNHPSRIVRLAELSSAYLEDGQMEKGIALLETIIELQRLTLDEDHPNLLASRQRLGSAYLSNGRTKEAVLILEETFRKRSRETLVQQLATQHELGRAYLENGQIRDAIDLFEEVVERKRDIFHEAHPEKLSSLHELGRAYLKNGQVKQGIAICENIVKIQASVLDEGHPDQLQTQSLLGSGYLADNQTTRALDIFKKINKLQLARFDESHPDRLTTQHHLGTAYVELGQISKAINILQEAVRVAQTSLKEDHRVRLALQHQLASAYLRNGQAEDAIDILLETVRLEASSLAEDHPSRLASLHQLASAYLKGDQAIKAVAILEDVVRLKRGLNEGHPSLLASKHELACSYLHVDRVDDAITMYEEVVRVISLILKEDDPSRLVSQEQLGSAYLRKGRTKDAVKVLKEVVTIKRKSLERIDPSRLSSERELGLAYIQKGQGKKGALILEEVLGVEKQCLEQNHPLRLGTQYGLACGYLEMGQTKQAIALLEELVCIKELHRDGGYPSLQQVRLTLEEARDGNDVFSRTMLRMQYFLWMLSNSVNDPALQRPV